MAEEADLETGEVRDPIVIDRFEFSGNRIGRPRTVKILVLIYSLGPGGAQRAVVRWANHWVEKSWTVTIATLVENDDPPFYELDDTVRIENLQVAGHSRNPVEAISNNVRRLKRIRALTRQEDPHLLISVMDRTNVLALLATIGLKTPVVINEQTYPGLHEIGGAWEVLRKLTYRWADRLVCVSQGTLDWFPPAIREEGVVIANPISLPSRSGQEPGRNRTVLGMGRLSYEKGFDQLIRAFARASTQLPEWKLVIWGEGGERRSLEDLASELGVANKVQLPGVTEEPFEKMSRAGLFVLSSRYEGFGNVLVEAMATGTPVVSFRCPAGPEEIIRDGVDGVLVPAGDVEKLADAMVRLMKDPELRERFGERAREVRHRFAAERQLELWDALIEEVVGAGAR